MRIRPTLSIVYKTTPEMKYFLNQECAYAQPDRDVYKITIEMNTSLIQDTAYGIEMYTKLLLIRGHLFNQDLSMVLAEKRGVARSTPEIRTPAINWDTTTAPNKRQSAIKRVNSLTEYSLMQS